MKDKQKTITEDWFFERAESLSIAMGLNRAVALCEAGFVVSRRVISKFFQIPRFPTLYTGLLALMMLAFADLTGLIQ